MSADHHIAQLNVAQMMYTRGDPRMADFMDALDPINAIADASPGFVWRLQSDDGDATSVRILDDDMLLVNMSVWESVAALKTYACRTDHVGIFRRRAEWFDKPTESHYVLWWVPDGHVPPLDEAADRLTRLRLDGPGPDHFTFASVHEPPG